MGGLSARFDSLVHITADGSWPGRRDTAADLGTLLAAMDQASVARACLVSIAGVTPNNLIESAYRQHPERFIPVGSANPGAAGEPAQAAEEVRRLAERGFAGVKLHPRFNRYDPLDPRCLAAIEAAGRSGLVVFLDTLFRQPGRATRAVADVVDALIQVSPSPRLLLLHGGGSAILDLFELGRMHDNLVLDLSFTLFRYRGSSVDQDLAFMCRELDQRLVVGSDFPEFTPAQAFERLDEITAGLSKDKRDNITAGNLTRLFSNWPGMPGAGPTP